MKINTTTNELTLEKTRELHHFIALLFDSLDHIQLPYKAPATQAELSQYGLKVPKAEHEIIQLDFDYKPLLSRFEVWSSEKQGIIKLNKEEIFIFRKAMDCAYNFFIKRDDTNSDHLFVRYYEKHFAQ